MPRTAGERPHLVRRGLLVGLACTVLFLFLAFRKVEWAQTVDALRGARWDLLALGTAVLVATYGVFGARWRLLLADTASVSIREAFSYIMIGYLANTVLPLRLGDVTRAVLLARQHRVGTARVLGSVVLERVLDVVALLVIAVGLTALMDVPTFARTSFRVFAVLGTCGLAALAIVAVAGGRAEQWAERVPGRLLRQASRVVLEKVSGFGHGLASLRQAPAAAGVLALSVVAWGLAAVGTCVYVTAFDIQAPWYAGVFVLVVINFGSAIPSSPGFIGVYHFLAVLALGVWVPDRSAALAYAIGTHALVIVLNVALGSVFLMREGLTLGAVRRIADEGLPATHAQSDRKREDGSR